MEDLTASRNLFFLRENESKDKKIRKFNILVVVFTINLITF